jgi:hypothetical protein
MIVSGEGRRINLYAFTEKIEKILSIALYDRSTAYTQHEMKPVIPATISANLKDCIFGEPS